MMEKGLFILIFLLLTITGYCQQTVSFEELPQKMAAEPRPVVIKIYTDWCSICRLQDKQLSNNIEVKERLNEKFYYLELNAETRKTIIFKGWTYKFIPNGTGGINALAAQLCKSHSYPYWVFFSSQYEEITQWAGLLAPARLDAILMKVDY